MKSRYGDLIGKRFGRLTVIKDLGTDKNRGYKRKFLCKCDCGNIVDIDANAVVHLKTLSCGCLFKETQSVVHGKHHMSNTRLYRIWGNMKSRCTNENSPAWYKYGARGICLCDEWMSFEPFKNWALNNGYQDNLSIDRIKNEEGYRPDNCRWATSETQANNQTKNILIDYKGETKSLAEWCKQLHFNYAKTYARLYVLGWDINKAFEN